MGPQANADVREGGFKGEEVQGGTIWLCEDAAAIVRRLALQRPTGPLFLTPEGNPWNRFRLGEAFGRLSKKAKVPMSAYSLRHSWITDALTRGVDPVTVSKLAGHRDLSMISRVYGHIETQAEHMTNAVEKAVGRVSA